MPLGEVDQKHIPAVHDPPQVDSAFLLPEERPQVRIARERARLVEDRHDVGSLGRFGEPLEENVVALNATLDSGKARLNVRPAFALLEKSSGVPYGVTDGIRTRDLLGHREQRGTQAALDSRFGHGCT